jgi:hypothetical protein
MGGIKPASTATYLHDRSDQRLELLREINFLLIQRFIAVHFGSHDERAPPLKSPLGVVLADGELSPLRVQSAVCKATEQLALANTTPYLLPWKE